VSSSTAPRSDDALHDAGDEILGEVHVAGEVEERDLRLHHPELRQMAARLRLLGAKGRAEAVHLAERHARAASPYNWPLCVR
jgi:hypothetical protein